MAWPLLLVTCQVAVYDTAGFDATKDAGQGRGVAGHRKAGGEGIDHALARSTITESPVAVAIRSLAELPISVSWPEPPTSVSPAVARGRAGRRPVPVAAKL